MQLKFQSLIHLLAVYSTATFALRTTSLNSQSICSTPEFSNEFNNFTGLIVQHQKSLEYPPQNHLRVTRCLNGVDRPYDAYVPMNMVRDIPWGRKFCTGYKNQKSSCYVMARRRRFTKRQLSVYSTGEWVGGIFMCPGNLADDGVECTNENTTPLWPLVATDFSHYQENVRAHSLIRSSILVSYNTEALDRKTNPYPSQTEIPNDWDTYIDVSEGYRDGNVRLFENVGLDTWYYFLNTVRKYSKGIGYLVTKPSSAFFNSVGDLRARRPTRQLEPKVSYEQQPEKFHPVPMLAYLEHPELTREALKNALKSVKILSIEDDENVSGSTINRHEENNQVLETNIEQQTKRLMVEEDSFEGFDALGTPIESMHSLADDSFLRQVTETPESVTFNQVIHLASILPDQVFEKIRARFQKASSEAMEKKSGDKTQRFSHSVLEGYDASSLLESFLKT